MISFVAAAALSTAPFTYKRVYTNGQITRYSYTEQDAGSTARRSATAELTTVVVNGVGSEIVRWVALQEKTGHDLSAQARGFSAYNLSLDPRSAPLQRVSTQEVPELEGPVDDLLNFFVDLSPGVGVARLHAAGDSYTMAQPVSGDFSGAAVPLGRDLILLTTTLKRVDATQAEFQSSYQPPAGTGLPPYRPWMSAPVCGTAPNNFQTVEKQGPGFLALWGCESFVIDTIVDRLDGRIVSATMVNPLSLQGKFCQDAALTACSPIPDVHIERHVEIKRVSMATASVTRRSG